MTRKLLFRQNPELYEINTAAWLFELSQKAGENLLLKDVPSAEWDRLKERGMDFVWLMGVWSRSEAGRKVSLNSPDFHDLFEKALPGCQPEDIIGSCYSISSGDPDPLVGTWEDIDHVRSELHKRQMGLVLDFIPNHLGIDHPWLTEHPEYFIQGTEEDYRNDPYAFFTVNNGDRILYIAHGRDPYFPSWTDTSQLNYFNPETQEAMIDRLEELALHCDGVRCDMAMLVLKEVFRNTWGRLNKNPSRIPPEEEFWARAIRHVPDLVYIAEAYWDTEWTLQQLGFDFTYDKRLYDRLRNAPPHEVYLHLKADMDYQRKLLRFIENHDELRSLAAFGKGKVVPAAVLYSGLPGMKMYFHGQLEGKQIKLPIQIRQSRPDPVNPDIRAFYEKLLSVVNGKICHDGEWRLKEVLQDSDDTQENLVAYLWKLEGKFLLFICNLSPNPSLGRVSFADDVRETIEYTLAEKLTGAGFRQNGKLMAHPGLRFVLDGYQAQIFEISPAAK